MSYFNKKSDRFFKKNSEMVNKLKINKTNNYILNSQTNNNFGFEFEDSIISKTLINLNVKSINDTSIYTKQYRHFFGLKILIVNRNTNNNDIIKMLDEGIFRIIPFSNKYYEISFKYCNIQKYFIGYNDKLKVLNAKFQEIYYYTGTIKGYNDDDNFSNNYKNNWKYKEKEYFYFNLKNKNNYSNYQILLFPTECEVDGLFYVEENIPLSKYKSEEIYSNIQDKIIKKDSFLVYEIKSGTKIMDLIDQMKRRGNFIQRYLEFISKKSVFYIGFYNTKKSSLNFNIEKDNDNFSNNNNKKQDNIYKNYSNTNNDENNSNHSNENNSSNNNNHSDNDNHSDNNNQTNNNDNNNNCDKKKLNDKDNNIKTPEEGKNNNNSDKNYNSENTEDETNLFDADSNEGRKKKSLKDNENEIRPSIIEIKETKQYNEYTEEDKKFDETEYARNKLSNLLPKITIFSLDNSIFGQNLKYQREEYNLLGELKDELQATKREFNKKLSDTEEKFSNKFSVIDKKLNAIEETLKQILDKVNQKNNNI